MMSQPCNLVKPPPLELLNKYVSLFLFPLSFFFLTQIPLADGALFIDSS